MDGDMVKLSSTEQSGTELARVEWNYSGMGGIDNKIGTTLASAHVLCLDLLLHV